MKKGVVAVRTTSRPPRFVKPHTPRLHAEIPSLAALPTGKWRPAEAACAATGRPK